jgi:pantoate--beta-alanine ligase
MGALHAGHLSLVRASRRECDLTVVSIFVNPTQFGPGEDFSRYPRTFDADLALLAGEGPTVVFAPTPEAIYQPGAETFVDVGALAEPWEGRHRPGHFRGVATIVLKLFHLIPADAAYFGRKDYQQALVIRRMVEDLDVPIDVRVCPTVREPDGLAMSSRNRYLAPDERRRALAISEALRLADALLRGGERRAEVIAERARRHLHDVGEIQLDYVAVADPATLAPLATVETTALVAIAARVGSTRLIDNATIGAAEPNGPI